MISPELDAYGKIANAIALWVFGALSSDEKSTKNELNLPPPYFHTYSDSLRGRSGEWLWRLKILRSLYQDNRCGDFFVFDCELADVPATAITNANEGPSLEELVWLYIELRSEYTQLHLHRSTLFFIDHKPAFSISEEERPAFTALEYLGYARGVPDGYAATAKTEILLSTTLW